MYMFRTISCSSSGGQIVLIQHLVSSLSVSDRPVHSTERSLTDTYLHIWSWDVCRKLYSHFCVAGVCWPVVCLKWAPQFRKLKQHVKLFLRSIIREIWTNIFASAILITRHIISKMPEDEDIDCARNVGSLAIQPPHVAASARIFCWI